MYILLNGVFYPFYYYSPYRFFSIFWFLFFIVVPLAIAIYIFNNAPKYGKSQLLAFLGFFSVIGLIIYLLTRGEKVVLEEGGEWFMAHGAKRAYFYLISFIALAVLFFGVADLIRVILEYSWAGEAVRYGGRYGRESFVKSVSFRLAAVIVSFPVWLFHWLHIDDQLPKVEDNREQKISFKTHRGYLYIVSGLSALLFLVFGIWFLTQVISLLLGASNITLRSFGAPLGYGLVSALAFWFHFQAIRGQKMSDLESKLKSAPPESPAIKAPPEPAEKFCAKCGEKANPADTFCRKCGTKL